MRSSFIREGKTEAAVLLGTLAFFSKSLASYGSRYWDGADEAKWQNGFKENHATLLVQLTESRIARKCPCHFPLITLFSSAVFLEE